MKMKGRMAVKLLAALAAVLCFGLAAEWLCSLPARRSAGAGHVTALDLSTAQLQGFALEEGHLRLMGDSGYITVPLNGSYITSFCYNYEYAGPLKLWVRLGRENIFGLQRREENIPFVDTTPAPLSRSVIPVNGRCSYVEIGADREMLREAGLEGQGLENLPLVITGMQTECRPAMSWQRLLFFWAAGAALAAGIGFRNQLARYPAAAFLVIALGMGTLYSVSLPVSKVGWDEEVHFSQALWLANYKKPMAVTDTLREWTRPSALLWPLAQPGGNSEQNMLERWADSEARYGSDAGAGEHTGLWSDHVNWTAVTGYPVTALFLRIGEMLSLPFSRLYRLGRLANVLAYSLLMAAAIHLLPRGKGMMSFLGLMPEPLLLAGVYSYDPIVMSCLAVTAAALWAVLLDREKRMTLPMAVIILLSFVWGCRIKAVYAPLILAALLIPEDRFGSRKSCRIFRAGVLAVFLLLMASFILPVLLAPRDIGDLRGGATSEKGQMAYILGQPAAYARLLASSIIKTLPSYCLGEKSLGLLGHLGAMSFPWILYAGSAYVIWGAADGCDSLRRAGKREISHSLRNRIVIFGLIAVTGVLIWTSMYIAFTEPGSGKIEGVQGRYYLPFLFMLWQILAPGSGEEEERKAERKKYLITLALAVSIALGAYYLDIYLPYCR